MRLCYNQEFVSKQQIEILNWCSTFVLQNEKMRDEYISNVKGGRIKRLSAFLADRDWSATGGVSRVFKLCTCSSVFVCVQYCNAKTCSH